MNRTPQTSHRPGPLVKALLKAPSGLYDARCGWLLGGRFLRLTHRGRKSGREYRTVLEVVGHLPETGEVVVVAGLGARADWFRNIQAAAPVLVETGRRRFEPVHRVLDPGEAAEVMAGYERRNRLAAPVIRIVLSRLLGWEYDGGETARARLVRELPFVAFRPDEPGRSPGPDEGGAARLRLAVAEPSEGVHLVELRGELDVDGAVIVLDRVSRLVIADTLTVLDAGPLEFLDSGGLHALIVLGRIAETRRARLRLANPGPEVRRVLERTHAARVIDVRADLADALEN